MGVVRLDGNRGSSSGSGGSRVTSSSSYTPSMPTRPATFQAALDQAQTASDAAAHSKDPNLLTIAAIDWGIVQDMETEDYRLAATSSDPAGQTAALDKKYGSLFRGHHRQTEFYDTTWHAAKAAVQKETPDERQYQIKLYNSRAKVQETYQTLKSATSDADKGKAYTAYSAAVRDQINLQLEHELGAMPAGPGGSHTLDQWKQVGQNVKKENGATDADSGQVIDSIALVSGYMDQIQHNRGSLNLTPTEQALAESDPATLAFVKAAGITLNPDDSKLSPLMKDLAKRDPVLFTMLQVAKINVYTDGTAVLKDTAVGQLPNGQFLHVTVNGTPLHDPNFINHLAEVYRHTEEDHRAMAVGAQLMPTLNLQDNSQLQALMMAADNARAQWAPQAMKDLMSGANPDAKRALSFLNTQLNGFFNPGDRAAFWESSGKPYFTQDYFRKQFQAQMPKPNRGDPNYFRDMENTELNADKVGKYLQDILKDAPKEVAGVILDTVMSSFNKDWYHSNKYDMSGASPRFENFYKGLSLAVDLAPDRAKDVVHWLMDRKGPQAGVLIELWGPELRRFEGVKKTMEQDFGVLLSKTLNDEVQGNRDFQNMAWDLKIRYDQGDEHVQKKYAEKINNQAYAEFDKDPDKVLMPFFKSFLGDSKVGKPVDFKDETQLRNMIGKALGLVPTTNLEAASAKDYSKEWYTEFTLTPHGDKITTVEWNKITLIANWIHDQGGDTPNITALPFKYVSQRDGLQTGALFLINKPGDDTPVVIDGAAADDAVDMNGGKPVDAKDVNFQWHYDDFKNFQDDNHYDTHGDIYLPTNMILDPDNDGKITSKDYEKHHAAIETGWETTEKWGMLAVTATGIVLSFVAPPVGLTILAGAAVLDGGYNLYKMQSHGESISWDNPNAQGIWLSIGVSVLPFGRLGILKTFGETAGLGGMFARGSAALMGTTAGVVGMSQAISQAGFLIEHIGDPNVSVVDKLNAFAGAASALMMVKFANVRVRPRTPRGQQQGLPAVMKDPVPGKVQTTETVQTGEPGYTVTMSPGRASRLAEAKSARSDRVITNAQMAVQRVFGKWIGAKPSSAPIRLNDAEFDTVAARLVPKHSAEDGKIMAVYDTKTGQIYLRNRGDNYLEAVSGVNAGHEYVHAVGSPSFHPATRNLVIIHRTTGENGAVVETRVPLIEGVAQYLTFKALGPEKYTQQPGGYGKYLQALKQGRNVESTWARTYTAETVAAERIFTRLGDKAYEAYFGGGRNSLNAFKQAALQDPQVVKGRPTEGDGLAVRFGSWMRRPVAAYGPAMAGAPRQTAFGAFKLWMRDGATTNGTAGGMWTAARTRFQNAVGRPAYDAWDNAGRPPESWWTDAVNSGKYTTPEQIAEAAYLNWDSAGRPSEGVALNLWTKSAEAKIFNRSIRTTYRAWQAEQTFAAQIGKPGYEAHRASLKAGNAEERWWTQAKADPTLRAQIDRGAQDAFTNDPARAPGATASDLKYVWAGEEAVAGPLGLKAYQIWNEGIPASAVPARAPGTTTLASPRRSRLPPWQKTVTKPFSHYTYRQWVKANKPGRTTDAIPFAELQQLVKYKRLGGWADKLMPKKLTQKQADRLGLWLDNRGTTPTIYTPVKYSPRTVSGPWWKAFGIRTLNGGGRTVFIVKKVPKAVSYAWRGGRLNTARFVSAEANILKMRPADVTIWSEQERIFRARIRKSPFENWVSKDRPLGAEDGFFTQANQEFKALIAARAVNYYQNPGTLPLLTAKPRTGGAPWWAKKGLNTSVDQSVAYTDLQSSSARRAAIPGEVDTVIASTGADWATTGNVGLPYFKQALLDPGIAKAVAAKEAQNTAAGIPNPLVEAQKTLAPEIAGKAYQLWKNDNSPAGTHYHAKWTDALAKENELTDLNLGLYAKWQGEGSPGGFREAPWVRGTRDARGDGAYGNRYVQFGQDARASTGAYFRQMWQRAAQRGGIFDDVGYRQWSTQMFGAMGSTLKWYGIAYAGSNLIGMIGWAGANKFTEAHRTSPMRSPEEELKAFLANPNGYVAENYENYVFGIPVDDRGYQSDGHVMAFTGPDGKFRYFQRIPDDLYEKLKAIPAGSDKKPWLLDTDYQLNHPQLIQKADGISIYETLPATRSGTFADTFQMVDLDPFTADPTQLADEVKEQIGMRAYMQWVKANRPMTSPAALLWTQAETDFQNKAAGAYDLWTAADRPNDPYWTQAANDFKSQVEKDPDLVKIVNNGGTYTPAQYNQAEKKYRAEIAMRAHQYWTALGTGKRETTTLGNDVWRQFEPDFQTAVAVPGYDARAAELAFQDGAGYKAYDAWVIAVRPGGTTGPNKYWQWAKDSLQGQPGDEASHGAEIAMRAYTNWALDGRNPQTVGADIWAANEPIFTDVSKTFPLAQWQALKGNLGNNASTPWTQNDSIWKSAVDDWNTKDGQPIMPLVQVRLPYKTEGNKDGNLPRSEVKNESGPAGFRKRFIWADGPIEGWRAHVNLELDWNYRYNIATTTTFRVGGPSPTQGWNVDVRQQDTTMWSRVVLSLGTMEYNGAQVYDLTDGSRVGWSVMNTRLYADLGNRNRTQIDFTDKFLRGRETFFVEIGVGADFFKRWSGDQTFNVNGYYELQFYPGDARAQLTYAPNNSSRFAFTRGYQAFPPMIGIDPAFQISWTDARIRLTDISVDGHKLSDVPFYNGKVR